MIATKEDTPTHPRTNGGWLTGRQSGLILTELVMEADDTVVYDAPFSPEDEVVDSSVSVSASSGCVSV